MFLIDRELEGLVAFRQALHRQPEVSGEERETAVTIAAALGETKPEAVITGLGGHGVAAIYEGDNQARRLWCGPSSMACRSRRFRISRIAPKSKARGISAAMTAT